MSRLRAAALLLTAITVLTSCGQQREPLVPADAEGALFGAYVSPERFVDDERARAVESFEGRVGRELAISMTYHPFTDDFPSDIDRWLLDRGTVLMLSWGGTSTEEIVAGDHDDLIRERARALAELDGEILLRWRWEMNRPNLREEIPTPEDYVAAWRHVRSILTEEDAEVDWVWCPLARDFVESDAAAYYPGDDEVEWLCVDAYSPSPDVPLEDVMQPFMEFAAEHPDKPVVIGEFGTFRGAPGERARWLDDAMGYLATAPAVRAILYYESDNAPVGELGLSSEPDALEVFAEWGGRPHFNPGWGPPA